MYIEKGKEISKEVIKKALENKLNSQYYKSEKRKIKSESFGNDIDGAVNGLYELNQALLENRDVFVECVKEPRGNLDTGRHYWDIYYIKDNKRIKFWIYAYCILLGGIINNRDRSISKYIWGSGAIGMSRLLHSTDGIFTFLKKLGGCYCQLS